MGDEDFTGLDESIRNKISSQGLKFSNLPNDRETHDWFIIQEVCELTKLELISLKNFRFPPKGEIEFLHCGNKISMNFQFMWSFHKWRPRRM